MIKNLIGYLGTYTDGVSKGIYKFYFNESTGQLSNLNLAINIDNPTYLVINSSKNKLYSVVKNATSDDITLGGVASFDINEDYTLSLTKAFTEIGKPPCHVNLLENDRYLVACNYHDKHATTYTLDNNKNIDGVASKVIHKGSSHIHYAAPTPDNKYVCILDLGRDLICLYSLINGKLTINEDLTIITKKGSGPRHMIFSPCGKFAYVLCELSSEVITLKYLGVNGFKIISYTSTLPHNFNGTNSTAAIRILSNGKFLYCSNRGHDSIAAYKIGEDGSLNFINTYLTYGREPRDFNLTPNENFMVIGNHKSNTITVYSINDDGTLTLISRDNFAPSPVCITFI